MRRSRQPKTSVLSSTKNQNTLAWSGLMFLTLVFQLFAFSANGNTNTNDLTFTDCSNTPSNISGFLYMGEHNGSKYFCSNQNKTWSEAVALVQANGGHIAVIDNATENSFLAANVIADVAWIGYTDEASEGNFHWYNGANSSYTNWTGEEPNNTDPSYTGADYGVIEKTSGDWYDRSGSNAYEVIMEIPCAAACSPELTINNNGSCPVRLYHWITSGDVFLTELAAGASYDVSAYDGAMYRAINTNHGSNLSYDVHTTVSGCDAQTWDVNPTYCAPACIERTVMEYDRCGTEGLINRFALSINEYSWRYPWTNVNFKEYADGTARLYGNIQNENDPLVKFYVDVTFSGRKSSTPAGVYPHSCLTPDTSGIYYYDSYVGFLTGKSAMQGAEISISEVGGDFQIGNGANVIANTTTDFGASSWFNAEIISQPNNTTISVDPDHGGDIHLVMSGGYPDCLFPAQASIGDKVFDDKNGNGFQDAGDNGIDGVTVMLLDANGDMVGIAQTTANGGQYLFSGLADGDYKVKFTAPNGLVFTEKNQSEDDDKDSDAIVIDGTNDAITATITISNGEVINNVDAGLVDVATLTCDDVICAATCTRTVTPTQNCSDSGFEYLNHVNADVSTGTGYVDIDGTTTWEECAQTGTVSYQSSGYYGDDFVTFNVTLSNKTSVPTDSPKDHKCLTPNTSDWVYYEDICGELVSAQHGTFAITKRGPAFQVGYGANVQSSDLGFGGCGWLNFYGGDGFYNFGDINIMLSDAVACSNGSIGNLVFEDKNGNGIQDTNEPGIDGVTVMLLDANGDMVGTAQTTTNGGQYLFTDLAAGDYKVKFTAPTGYTFTNANKGNDDAKDSDAILMAGTDDAMTDIFTLNEGDNIDNVDAGIYVPVKLGNKVFEDTNENGIQDAGEAGIDGVTITLVNFEGTVVGTTTTANGGEYEFAGLIPGDYKVIFPLAATTNSGATANLTSPNQGGDDTKDSDANLLDGSTNTIFLASGDDNQTIDAGYVPGKASIGDFVFEDKNGNGLQDAGEPGIDGVTVMLLDANGDMVGTAQTTANGGAYDFANVAPGTYKIKFTAPTQNGVTAILTDAGQGTDESKDSDAVAMAGSDDAMTQFVTVNSGDDENDLDAGYYFPAKLGNFVFEDTNENGIQDLGENGIDGVVVTLLDSNGNPTGQTATTANGGLYEFAGLAPGDYKVLFPQAATTNAGTAADLTSPNQGNNDAADSDAVPMPGTTDAMSQVVTLESGDNDDTIDAGYVPGKASIGDVIFEDKNGNGIQDTDEPGLSDVIVMLLDANGDMVGDAQITGTDGAYDFTNVAPGTYKVKFTAPTQNGITAILTDANQGTDDTKDSDAVAMAGTDDAMSQLVTLVANDDIDDVDAGYYFPAKLGNFVFEDANLDGIQDLGEAGIEGVPVELRDAAGTTLDNTTTDANGLYEFAGLAPGDYKVVFPTQANVADQDIILTKANQGGDDTKDSDAVPMAVVNEAMSQVVTLESGDNDDTIDAGYIAAATLGDKAFIDEDQNGLQESSESPLPGVTVTLTGTDIFGNDVSATQITDDNGEYLFTMLVPGTYEVQFSQPATYVVTGKDAQGNDFDFADSDINPLTGKSDPITLGSGEDNRSVDAGFFIDPALPVALTSFEAQLVNNNEVVLKWATASEEDNSHFVVERSLDGRDFEAIGIIEGNGTTNQVNTYTLVDADPAYGYNYYRLKQVDFDGDYEFSHIETVIISSQDIPDVILYPNPVVKTTTLRVVTPFETDANIEFVDFTGKVLLNVVMAKGANSKQLDLSGFAAGTYFAYVNYNGHRELVHKIIKVEE